jgi:hypothetical protein
MEKTILLTATADRFANAYWSPFCEVLDNTLLLTAT